MQRVLSPLDLLPTLPVRGELALPGAGPHIWPSPITAGFWVDLSGCSWRRRGRDQSLIRLYKLTLDLQVLIVVLYAFEVRVVPDDAREPVAATLKAYWRKLDHETINGAEFKNDAGGRLVILEVAC